MTLLKGESAENSRLPFEAGETVMLSEVVAACWVEAESFTWIQKVVVVAVVGVPLIVPLLASVRPVGSEPELTFHV